MSENNKDLFERKMETESISFETPLGGVMTNEVGNITGPVELFIEDDKAYIRYEGAEDVYTVSGKVNGRSLDEVEKVLTTDPGVDEYDNPKHTSLEDLDSVESPNEAMAETSDEESEKSNLPSYVCTVCGYIYDPANGDPDNGVPAGTSFEDIPDDWVCPVCGVEKDMFELV